MIGGVGSHPESHMSLGAVGADWEVGGVVCNLLHTNSSARAQVLLPGGEGRGFSPLNGKGQIGGRERRGRPLPLSSGWGCWGFLSALGTSGFRAEKRSMFPLFSNVLLSLPWIMSL